MSERAAYFTVSRVMGREVPAIFWDELPRTPIRNLEYVVRLDQLPNGSLMVRAPLSELLAIYQHLQRRGKLPPRWVPPPRQKAQAPKVLVGHREAPWLRLPHVKTARPEEEG